MQNGAQDNLTINFLLFLSQGKTNGLNYAFQANTYLVCVYPKVKG